MYNLLNYILSKKTINNKKNKKVKFNSNNK